MKKWNPIIRKSFFAILCIALLFTGCGKQPEQVSDPEREIKEQYLSGYSELNLAIKEPVQICIDYGMLSLPSEDARIELDYDGLTRHFGRDISPNYIPRGLQTPAEAGKEQSWVFYRLEEDLTAHYKAGAIYPDYAELFFFQSYPEEESEIGETPVLDSDTDYTNYVYSDYLPAGYFSPVNRGIHIRAKSTPYESVEETQIYKFFSTEDPDLSYYGDIPILIWREADAFPADTFGMKDTLHQRNDAQTTVKYQTLLADFLASDIKPQQAACLDLWSHGERWDTWNTLLMENGFLPEGKTTYRGMFVYGGVLYEMSTNLDFDTFAAVIASTIDDAADPSEEPSPEP